jgi:hypothetical protein
MKRPPIQSWLAVFAAGLFGVATSSAQTLTATFTGVNPGVTSSGTLNGGSFTNTSAGVMDFSDFNAFCIEPDQFINNGETVVYQVQSSATLASADAVGRILGGFLLSDQSANQAAAAQWAIWEVLVDPSPNALTTGDVRMASGTIRTLATSYLTNLGSYPYVDFQVLTNPTRQDMVVIPNAIPEPSAAAFVALSALGLLRRRRA